MWSALQIVKLRVNSSMREMLKKIILVGGLLVSASAWSAVTTFELKNGLKVVVKEDHRAPVVVHQVWYRVGSNYEHNGITGLSHMLEHMMFKGTKAYKDGEFSQRVSKMGGQENAFTSSDYTVYYQMVGKQHLEAVMKLEADRMRNLQLDDKDFQKERDVVTEERRWRTEDNPNSKLSEQFNAMAFVNSPPHHPVVGWMQDIKSWTLPDLEGWYQRWYAPNNATLVVVGDVDPKQVKKWAIKYYGVHNSSKLVPPKPQLEMLQEGERRMVYKGTTKLPSVMMGFHVPTLVTAKTDAERKEAFALSLLSSVLDGDDSARLPKSLVRESKLLAGVSTSYQSTSRLQTLFIFQMTPSKGVTTQQAEKAIWKAIKKLQDQPVSQQELDRVLAQEEAAYVFGQDSIQGQAMILGTLSSTGLPLSTVDNWVKSLRSVTPKDIQAVANKYFNPDKVTVGTLLPNGKQASSKNMAMPSGALR